MRYHSEPGVTAPSAVALQQHAKSKEQRISEEVNGVLQGYSVAGLTVQWALMKYLQLLLKAVITQSSCHLRAQIYGLIICSVYGINRLVYPFCLHLTFTGIGRTEAGFTVCVQRTKRSNYILEWMVVCMIYTEFSLLRRDLL